MSDANELDPSELGTHEYWSQAYDLELEHMKEFKDPGTEWFGTTATKRMVSWIQSCDSITVNSAILDIGCGNGLLLLELARKGYENLVGADYCSNALVLAKEVFMDDGYHDNPPTKWVQLDICRQLLISLQNGDFAAVSDVTEADATSEFDVCTDKGTYDAISLCPDDAFEKRQSYIRNVRRMLKKGGYYVIASCNWCAGELKSHFFEFKFVRELPAPTFTFGGKTGKTVTTCIFQKSTVAS